jgi:hypothetical protein
VNPVEESRTELKSVMRRIDVFVRIFVCAAVAFFGVLAYVVIVNFVQGSELKSVTHKVESKCEVNARGGACQKLREEGELAETVRVACIVTIKAGLGCPALKGRERRDLEKQTHRSQFGPEVPAGTTSAAPAGPPSPPQPPVTADSPSPSPTPTHGGKPHSAPHTQPQAAPNPAPAPAPVPAAPAAAPEPAPGKSEEAPGHASEGPPAHSSSPLEIGLCVEGVVCTK